MVMEHRVGRLTNKAASGREESEMNYAATIRPQGRPPVKVGPFGAKNDDEAVAIICGVAINADAKIEMLWETRDGKARKVGID